MRGFQIIGTILLGLLSSSAGLAFSASRLGSSDVPAEFQQLYSTLNASLENYDAYLNTQGTGKTYPVIFGAELLPANANRGSELLTPQAMGGVTAFLDRFRQLGVQGVTFPVGYPLYTPDFPRYQEYVQFFKQVAQEVRKRDMKLAVESAIIFANTPFSPLKVNYAGLTFEKFKAERKQMIKALLQDLRPDYLNLGAEPDTEYQLIGLKELNSPEKYAEYIITVLDGLDRGGTKIGAGIGTWGNLEYVKLLAARTTLDSIHIHVYPITGDYLQKIFTIAGLARQYGKRLVLDEAWLYKVDRPSANGVAASPEIFRRDVFGFWAPLDQKFLAVIAKAATLQNIEYISPFWTQFFFGYADYNQDTANLPYNELAAMVNRIAAGNILAGEFTSTGKFYKELITNSISVTTTASALTTTMLSTTESVRVPVFQVGLIIVGLTIGVLALSMLRHRKKGATQASPLQ